MARHEHEQEILRGHRGRHILLVLLIALLFLPSVYFSQQHLLRYLLEFTAAAVLFAIVLHPILTRSKRKPADIDVLLQLAVTGLFIVLSEVVSLLLADEVLLAASLGMLCRGVAFIFGYKALLETDLRTGYQELLTYLQRNDEAMRRERDFFANVIDAAGGLLVIYDADGRIVRMNEACERLSGRRQDEAVGQPIWEVIYDLDEAASARRMIADLKLGLFPSYHESYWNTGSGERRCIAWSSTVLQDDDGMIEYVIGTGMEITAQKALEKDLHRLTLLDPLTGLYNRRGFMLFASQQLQLAERMRRSVLIFFCDIDRMKAINDAYGHKAGDEAVLAVTEALQETFRASDVIGRFGGDEFVVLAVEQSAANPEDVQHRLHTAVQAGNQATNRQFPLSVSVGLAHFDPYNPHTLEQLLDRADSAMYEAKSNRQFAEA